MLEMKWKTLDPRLMVELYSTRHSLRILISPRAEDRNEPEARQTPLEGWNHMQHQGRNTTVPGNRAKRTRLVRPYPVHTLEEAMVIPRVIQETNAGLPFDRVLLAKALGTTPASSGFTMKLNSCVRYGLTQGGYSDESIALTTRGESAVAPERDGEKWQALLDAAVQPEPFTRFYKMLDGKRVPEDTYSQNMLQRELGINAALTVECLRIIKANGLYVGILGEVGGSLYVSTAGAHAPEESGEGAKRPDADQGLEAQPASDGQHPQGDGSHEPGKIFIGHAGNSEIADFLKAVLDPFRIPYDVVECDYDAGRPVTGDVSEQMRQCNSAIFIFAEPSDESWTGRREEKHREKMLYQLGAASVLFGDRIIALRDGDRDPEGNTGDFHTLPFDRGRMDEVGLPLLAELHRMGVIEVRA